MNSPIPSSPDHKKQDFLAPFKSVFFQYFEQLVDSCCLRLDLEFGLQLGKDRDKTSMENYKNLLEYLRSVRGLIKRDYLLRVNENFNKIDFKKEKPLTEKLDMATIALASDEFVKEDYASTLIIRHCERMHHEDLARLNKLIAALLDKSAITDRQNPVTPENLIRALFEVIKPLKFNPDHRVALYKTFEADVFSQMGFIYRELIKHCETNVSKPNLENRAINGAINPSVPSETVSGDFLKLQEKLAQWRNLRAPSDHDLIASGSDSFFEHFEIKNALHVLGQFSTITPLNPKTKKQPLKWQVIKRLEELNFSDETKTLAKTDEDALDLVSLIFEAIADTPYVSDTLKALILQLEIPMSAACLGQYSAFTNPDSPPRKLLDQLFSASLLLNADNESNRLIFERITGIIKKIRKNSGFEISGWAEAAQDFEQFLDMKKKESRVLEESWVQNMIEQEAHLNQNKEIFDAIENSFKNKTLPPIIIDFLQNIWQDVMLKDYAVKDQQPDLWKNSVQTMNELVSSVIPPADDNERKRILKFIPGMINALRKGLKRISCDKAVQSRFFKELVVLHILLMDNKETKKTEAGLCNDKSASPGRVAMKTRENTERFNNPISDLKEGRWIVLGFDTEKSWAKLARKSGNNENLLFVGKNGEKIMQIDADELAEKFSLGQAALIEINDQPITGRVLSELLS